MHAMCDITLQIVVKIHTCTLCINELMWHKGIVLVDLNEFPPIFQKVQHS